ncbi:MAG: STAS/SEC14 domain-containing protein [Planctomycetes bacterium]|nr:STAS/SEC14 domain-containing protein [Planctomycetota bacterium]
MPVTMREVANGKILEIHATGKLKKEDYTEFVPVVEHLIQRNGKLRILLDLHDFHGWKMGALWEDLKFDAKHFKDIERLAMVGEKKWHSWMSVFCKPFTTAEIRYFKHYDSERAHLWISEGLAGAPVELPSAGAVRELHGS